jgi:cation transport ATPase
MTQPAEVSVSKSVNRPVDQGLEAPTPSVADSSHISGVAAQAGYPVTGDAGSADVLSISQNNRPTSSRAMLLLGATVLAGGGILWGIATDAGSERAVGVIGAAGAFGVAVAALYGALRCLTLTSRAHNIFALLPLGGLFLLALSTLVRCFLGESEFSPQGFAAPLVLAGIYLLMRGVTARAWERSGVESSAFFPLETSEGSSLVEGGGIKLERGSVVEVDARVKSGSVAVQERYLSPVSSFRIKDETEVLYAGSLVTGGSAEAVALSDRNGACLRRLEKCVAVQLQEAQSALLVRDQNSSRLVAYGLLFGSVSAAIFWNERGVSPAVVLAAAGLVLFAATLGLVADLVYASFTGLVRGWARKGLVLLNADSFNVLANTKEVAFDPSTVFSPNLCRVRDLEILDDRINRDALCSTLASFLGRSEDAGFLAFGNYCASVSSTITPERVLDLREYPGTGLCGSIKGIEFSIGTEVFLVERGIMMQPSDGFAALKPHERVLLVAIDSDVIARCVLSYGQPDLIPHGETEGEWGDMPQTVASVAAPDQGEFGLDVLLVRGAESVALGRTHAHEVAPLISGSLRPPQATVLSLTADYSALSELLRDCREHQKWAGLCRALIAAAGVVAIASVFAGFTSVWTPLVLIPVITVLVLL